MNMYPDGLVTAPNFRRDRFELIRELMPKIKSVYYLQPKPCCQMVIFKMLSVSRNFLHHKHGEKKAIGRKCPKFTSISFIPMLEKMPDTDFYQVSAPRRSSVWEFYCDDQTEHPELNLVKVIYHLSVINNHIS